MNFDVILLGSRVIAHWPGLPAKLAGKVIGIEHGKYYVEYDDGDKHHNTIDQLRILKPPLYFGKLSLFKFVFRVVAQWRDHSPSTDVAWVRF